MSFLSKLFRGSDQPPAEATPAGAAEVPAGAIEPPADTETEQQPALERAADVPPEAEQAPQNIEADGETPWWEEAAAESAPEITPPPDRRSRDDPEADQTAPAVAVAEISPITEPLPRIEVAEDEGTRPLTPTDMPTLVARRSPRGLAAAAQRDIGRVRSINQDSVFALLATLPRESSDISIGLFIVADGMGGHDGGEIASRLAVTNVARDVLAELVLPALADNVTEALQPLIIAAVQNANRTIWEHAQTIGSDMGTTCTVALLLGHALYIGHVGDSRAYLATPTGMRVLTNDHSAVGRLIQVGQLDPSEAREHPMRSQLYRTVGQHPEVAVDFVYQPLGNATHLLLCSDGLWGMVDDESLLEALEHSVWPQDACHELIARANLAGGDDNISAVVVTLPLS